MLLTIDIGNTSIHLGVFDGPNLVKTWKLQSATERTCDEYSLMIYGFFRAANLNPENIDGVIISSVVPPLTPVFQNLSQQLFKVKKKLLRGTGMQKQRLWQAIVLIGDRKSTRLNSSHRT